MAQKFESQKSDQVTTVVHHHDSHNPPDLTLPFGEGDQKSKNHFQPPLLDQKKIVKKNLVKKNVFKKNPYALKQNFVKKKLSKNFWSEKNL